MAGPNPKILRETIFQIIRTQMRDGTPPETKQTYDRLILEGHSHEETMKMIGCVVSSEVFDILDQNQPYNAERYVAALRALPELPWDEDE